MINKKMITVTIISLLLLLSFCNYNPNINTNSTYKKETKHNELVLKMIEQDVEDDIVNVNVIKKKTSKEFKVLEEQRYKGDTIGTLKTLDLIVELQLETILELDTIIIKKDSIIEILKDDNILSKKEIKRLKKKNRKQILKTILITSVGILTVILILK